MTEYMSPGSLEIQEIESVSLIKYYTLPGGIPGLMMVADRNKLINLAACDPGYRSLEYAAVNACIKHPEAAADSITREILESRREEMLPEFLQPFEGNSGSCLPIIGYEKNFPLALEGLIYFLLEQGYRGIGSEISFRGHIAGYRERCSVKCTLDGSDRVLPFETSRTDTGGMFLFSNILSPGDAARISLECRWGELLASVIFSVSREVRREYRYDLERGVLRLRIFDGGEQIFNKSEELKPVTAGQFSGETKDRDISRNPGEISPGELISLAGKICCTDPAEMTVCPLPRGGIFLIGGSGDTAHRIAGFFSGGNAVLYHFYRKYVSGSVEKAISDSTYCVHQIFPLKSGRAVQTKCNSTGEFSRCCYREIFEGKYFTRQL